MSDKVDLKNLQTTIKEGETMEDQQTQAPAVRLCSSCKAKKTISPRHDICGSCLAAKGKLKREQTAKNALQTMKTEKVKEDKGTVEKAAHGQDMRVVVDFAKYPSILNHIQELADDQIRPLDAQIIYLLKSNLAALAYGKKPDSAAFPLSMGHEPHKAPSSG